MILGIVGLESGSKLCFGDAFVYGSSTETSGTALKQRLIVVFDSLNAKSAGNSCEC